MTATRQPQPWGHHGLMALCAVRYCLGRRTYITSECADWLAGVWGDLPERAQWLIQRDIEDAFAQDDRFRADGEPNSYRPLGDDCDRENWERVRRLWAGEAKP